MKKYRRITAAVIAAASLALTACGSAVSGSGTLRVGVKGDIVNFGLYDQESGGYSGMEIDLAEILAKDLGYRDVEFVTVSTASREEQLKAGEVDMLIATVTMTDERKAAYDFSDPYYVDHVGIMVEKSSLIEDLDDLIGCRVGVMTNANHALSLAQYMAAQGLAGPVDENTFTPEDFSEIEFVRYEFYEDISRALEYGDVDAFVADWSILNGFMDDGRMYLPDELNTQEYGVCTLRGSKLSAKIRDQIKMRIADGTIDELKQKWGN